MKTRTLTRILWISIAFSLFCCETNRTLIEGNYENPQPTIDDVNEMVQVGDYVNLKIKDWSFYNLLVEDIDGSVMTVKYHTDSGPVYNKIHLQYIKEIEVVELEVVYPVGAPVTVLLILFYLLV